MHPSDNLYPRPRILVSPCLNQVACRYDATDSPSPAVKALAPWVDLVNLCPEVEAGLSVPRPPMQYVLQGATLTLRQEQDATDLLPQLAAWAGPKVRDLNLLAGGIFKARSPSCAIDDCKLHQDSFNGPVTGQVPGFFVQALAKAQPGLAVINEDGFNNPAQRAAFLTQVFVVARYEVYERELFLSQHAPWLLLYEVAGGPLNQAARNGKEAFSLALRQALLQPPQWRRVADFLAQQVGCAIPQSLNEVEFSRWGQGLVLKYSKKFPWMTLIFHPFPPELA